MILINREMSTRPGIIWKVDKIRYLACWKQEAQSIREVQAAKLKPIYLDIVCLDLSQKIDYENGFSHFLDSLVMKSDIYPG